jgi:hypothetical protein
VRRTLRYVEPLSVARTPLAAFFSILLVHGAILATKGYPRQQKSRSRQSDLVFLIDLVCLVYVVRKSFNEMNKIDRMNQFSYAAGPFGMAGSDRAGRVAIADSTCACCWRWWATSAPINKSAAE